MTKEYNALLANYTWELVPFHLGKNVVGCKWVFRVKFNSDGSVEWYKARLLALGNHQQVGIDYHQSIHLILSLALTFG